MIRLFYTLRLMMLCAPLFWGALALFLGFMMGGAAVIVKTFLEASGALADAIYRRLTGGRVPEENGLYLICKIVAFIWIVGVWIVLSHFTVWLLHSVF